MSGISLADLDPFAVEPPKPSTRSSAFRPPARTASPLDFDLLDLGADDPLTSHAAAEATRRREERAIARQPASRPVPPAAASKQRSKSPPRTLLRRLSTSPTSSRPVAAARTESDAIFHPSSSPPATSLLSHFANQPRNPPRPPAFRHDTSFSDFQAAAPPSPSALGASLRSTWSSLKTTSRPALANIFAEPSSYHDEKPMPYFGTGNGADRASSWPSTPHRTESPVESAKPPAIRLTGVRDGLRATLDGDLAEALRPSLPPRVRLSAAWSLLYSLDQHGASLTTLYKRVDQADAPCVLVLRDGEGAVFGAFLNEPLRRSDGFYGNGECLLWKALPFAPGDPRIGIGVRAYKWTGRNTYCILSNDDYVSVGGGDGKYGLWVDAALERGFSARCPAFDNECLCSSTAKEASCEVLALEVWRVAPP